MSVIKPAERSAFRDLIKQYLELANDPIMEERRELWRRLHDLRPIRPGVLVTGGRVWNEAVESIGLQGEDPELRSYEWHLRLALFRGGIRDDTVFEPWLTVRPVFTECGWGPSCERINSPNGTGWLTKHPITDITDLSALRKPRHAIDEAATEARVARLHDLVGDLIDIALDRTPQLVNLAGDIASPMGHLRGIEQIMLDMCMQPEALHRLAAFLRDGILATHEQAEEAGDWGLTSHRNQAVAYGGGLPDPKPNVQGIKRSQLWGHFAAQEFAQVSPPMHEEFLLRYQLPIMKRFGLVAYGCCEDLTAKIDMLRQVPNLRRIAVTLAADIRACSEQIGTDYVISYRPNTAGMVCCGFDEDYIRRTIGTALEVFRGKHFDITLKDIDTAEGDLGRLRRWVEIVREQIERQAVTA
jgi:hypothetical protein